MALSGEDIATFSGFGGWMSTFRPHSSEDDHEKADIHELNAGPITPQGGLQYYDHRLDTNRPMVELPTNEDSWSTPVPFPLAPVPKPEPSNFDENKELEKQIPVFQQMPDPKSRIRVHGLQKVGQKEMSMEVVWLSAYSFLSDISRKLESLGKLL
jgi:hypothetical protein